MDCFVFDLDGTLYGFDRGKSRTLKESAFLQEMTAGIQIFLHGEFSLGREQAREMFLKLHSESKGEISLYLEKEYGIDRHRYFEATWGNRAPEKHILRNPAIPELFSRTGKRSAVLTASPRVWAEKALSYLGIREHVGERLFTGEPDERKPSPLAFQTVLSALGAKPENSLSVGDQIRTDILPAKSLGMRTVLVGSKGGEADYCIESIGELLPLLEKEGMV